ncbi:DUF3313 family protein [Aliagarivorans marinus]|uniref:DUF3313 family protein n=1 Tax=Aliagarivorans marinus TaxID=561965 RepID=UPI0003FE2DE5|nr:DUF3313 family protein [Aliagarivorans marinus]
MFCRLITLLVALSFPLLFTGCSTTSSVDASVRSATPMLNPHTTATGAKAWRWVDQELQLKNYHALKLHPLRTVPLFEYQDPALPLLLDEMGQRVDQLLQAGAMHADIPLLAPEQHQKLAGVLEVYTSLSLIELEDLGTSGEAEMLENWFAEDGLDGEAREPEFLLVLEFQVLDAQRGELVSSGLRQMVHYHSDNQAEDASQLEQALSIYAVDLFSEFERLSAAFSS